MRPAEFDDDQIIAAGEALSAAGRRVNGYALRQQLGGGNHHRLKRVWDAHLARRENEAQGHVGPIKADVAEQIETLTQHIHGRLTQLAVFWQTKHARDANKADEGLRRDLDHANQRLNDVLVELKSSRDEQERLAGELRRLQAGLKECQQHRDEALSALNETKQTNARLVQDSAQLRADRDALSRENQTAREATAHWQGRYEALERQNGLILDLMEKNQSAQPGSDASTP